jgi:hypothetical protein
MEFTESNLNVNLFTDYFWSAEVRGGMNKHQGKCISCSSKNVILHPSIFFNLFSSFLELPPLSVPNIPVP